MSDYLPVFNPGQQIPLTLSGTVTGGQLVTVAGAVGVDASITVAGVACFDGVSGQIITVLRDGMQRLTASATIAAGADVCCAASGQVRTWVTGTDAPASRIGKAWTAATSTQLVTVALFGV